MVIARFFHEQAGLQKFAKFLFKSNPQFPSKTCQELRFLWLTRSRRGLFILLYCTDEKLNERRESAIRMWSANPSIRVCIWMKDLYACITKLDTRWIYFLYKKGAYADDSVRQESSFSKVLKSSHKFSNPESLPLSMSFTSMSSFLIFKISDNLWTISGRVPVARIEGLQTACASRLRFKAAKDSWALACGLVIRGGKGKARYWEWMSITQKS